MAEYSAFGTQIYKGTSGAGTAYAQVVNISGPSMSVDMIDVTAMDSTGAWEELVAGVKRSGEMTLALVYDPADATHKNASGGLLFDFDARVAITFTIVFTDTASTEWTFSGFVSAFSPDAPHDGALTASVTIKPTGAMTLV